MTFVLVDNVIRSHDLGVAETIDSFIPGLEETCVTQRLVNPYDRYQYMIAVTYYGGVANPDTASNLDMRPLFNSMIAYTFSTKPTPAVEPLMSEVKNFAKMTRAMHYKNEFSVRIHQSLKR